MKEIRLKSRRRDNSVLLDHEFIDKYMPEANGEYVKVYLLVLRLLSDPESPLTISGIADILDCTEKDVIRALKYWKKQAVLDFDILDADEGPSGEPRADRESGSGDAGFKDEVSGSAGSGRAAEDSAPAGAAKSSARGAANTSAVPSDNNITQFRNRKELKELLFVAEQYMGRTLSATDMKTITYFYDTLGMSTDLIEYLIEYCVENDHRSIHYIQKVALSWADRKIKTVEEAKRSVVSCSKIGYAVLKAFGITGRAPASSESTYIRRWEKEYGFSLELILEACSRTMSSIHQPSFDYTESILKSWSEKGVKNKKDIEALDLAHHQEKGAGKRRASSESPNVSRNKFNNFEGRVYEDMDDLTRKLIQNQ